MSWAALAANQWVSRNDLQDAVTTGVFSLRPSQSIPVGNDFVTRSEVETWIFATVSSGAANQWPQKSWIVAIVSTTTTTTTLATTTTTTTIAPTTTTTTTTVATFRTINSFGVATLFPYPCDFSNFPTPLYVSLSNGMVYTDTALTTLQSGLAYASDPTDLLVLKKVNSGTLTDSDGPIKRVNNSDNITVSYSASSNSGGANQWQLELGVTYTITVVVTSSINNTRRWNLQISNANDNTNYYTSAMQTDSTVSFSIAPTYNVASCESLLIGVFPDFTQHDTTGNVNFTITVT